MEKTLEEFDVVNDRGETGTMYLQQEFLERRYLNGDYLSMDGLKYFEASVHSDDRFRGRRGVVKRDDGVFFDCDGTRWTKAADHAQTGVTM